MAPFCVELCAGGGGQALGLEQAGFAHHSLFEIDSSSCATLRWNRPHWKVVQADIKEVPVDSFKGIDFISGGLPCPPFSVAGRQLGQADERDLFPAALRLVDEARPLAVMIENVRGLLMPRFAEYRASVQDRLRTLGYRSDWRLLDCSDFGVSQYRRRAILVAIQNGLAHKFDWPLHSSPRPPTVGEKLFEQMASRGWPLAERWRSHANDLAPTVVGGSHKHGGPDLGPTRARKAWAALGVDGKGVANEPPGPYFGTMPRLTIPMVARIQGFPDDWTFSGTKTSAYKQVGNAFPPPVARSIATNILTALNGKRKIYESSWNNSL